MGHDRMFPCGHVRAIEGLLIPPHMVFAAEAKCGDERARSVGQTKGGDARP